MPTSPTHGLFGALLAPLFLKKTDSSLWMLAGAGAAMLPDLDVIAFKFNVAYSSPLGHRGFTHSFLFALIFACVIYLIVKIYRREAALRISLYVLTATVSHALLDMLTNGGLGVGLFIPFTNERYMYPWRPIKASPIGIGWFFTRRVWPVISTEMFWIWLPASLMYISARLYRWKTVN